jgi:hypothetical protein
MRRALVASFVAAFLVCVPGASALPRSFVGLYGDDAFYGDSSYRADQFAAEARLGVGIIRQPFEWSAVERSPGRFDFSDYDGFVADAARAGISVMPILIAPPQFRSSRPADSQSRAMFPPQSNDAYATFVGAAVARYGPTGSFWQTHPDVPFLPIHAWQVWNEPNIPNFWRSGVNAKEYVALLRAGSRAIRAADPGAEVVAAGLPNSSLGVPFLTYLDRMYRAGAKGLFDTLAIHPYSRDVHGLLDLVEHARSTMDRWDDGSRLWITEFGWSTGGDASAFRVSQRGQSDRIAAALSGLVAQRRALKLRGFVLFKWKDSVAPPEMSGDPWPLHTGLLDSGGAPKRGLWTFGRLVQALRMPSADWPPGAAAEARVSKRTVRLSPLGFAAVSLGCRSQDLGACQGVLRLTTVRAVRCGSSSLLAGTKLGAARFRIAVPPAIAPVRLRPTAAAAAKCAGRVRVRATVAPDERAQTAAAAPAVEFDLKTR